MDRYILVIMAVFLAFSTLLPIFDGADFSEVLVLPRKSLTDRTFTNLALSYNWYKNGSNVFTDNYAGFYYMYVDQKSIDWIEFDEGSIPLSRFTFIIPIPLMPFFPESEQSFYSMAIALNIFLASISLVVFYSLQIKLGLKRKTALLSSLTMAMCTGWLIYSRSFFENIFVSLMFLLSISYILKGDRKGYSLFYLFFFTSGLIQMSKFSFIMFLPIAYYAKKYLEGFDVSKLIFVFAVTFIVVTLARTFFFVSPDVRSIAQWDSSFYTNFQNFISAENTELYGYNGSSRHLSLIYSFEENPANAVFIRSYAPFAVLFSEKGIIFNSPFLIFSFAGIFLYLGRNQELGKALCFTALLFILGSVFLNAWYGGVTPRYVRHYFPAVFIFSFFAFFYIEQESKLWIRLVFLALVVVSFLNVTSLAVRSDWAYEQSSDLVSYDYVLWPYTPAQSPFLMYPEMWNLSGNCTPTSTHFGVGMGYGVGLVLDVCDSITPGYISKNILIGQDHKELEVEACSWYSGGDGLYLLLEVDDMNVGENFFVNDTCETVYFDISSYSDGLQHTIKLHPMGYNAVSVEVIEIKSVVLSNG